MQNDKVKHPEHYTKYSVEVIDITRYLPFCLGNVVKYVLRAPYKGGVEDCDKALQYLEWYDEFPAYMRPDDCVRFRENLQKLKDELASKGTLVTKLQAEFLIHLWNCAAYFGYTYDLSTIIKALREFLDTSK